jgi:4-amino-4-deoxy-L-arabinose transferase-like glycosyltransferase
VVLTVVGLLRVWLAARLAPFGDEAWYWQESRALDWSFSDLPLATAWLIRLGETWFGHSVLAMRAPFLLLGLSLPWILVGTGRRLFGAAAGWCAGTLALLLPLLGTLGIFALPDVPLTVASALALDALERAARRGRLRDWLLLGFALAGAWLCHYRAAMLYLAGLAFLAGTRRGRALWRDRGLWLALGVSALGLVPLLVFNWEHDFVALRFQLLERNPWQFHADALVQPLEQALVTTPLFYGLLLWVGWRCLRRAREGAPWDLFATAGLVPIVAFFLLGCFADDTRFRLHWPLPGYLPGLLATPPLVDQGSVGLRRWFAAAVFVAGLGSLATFGYLGAAAVPGAAAPLARVKAFPEHLVGWPEVAARTRELLAEPRFADAILVADNFMLAAELDFALGGSRPVYTLDHPINAKHGRAPQLALWHRDEQALRGQAARPLLLVAEPTARRERERLPWLETLCARLDGVTPVAALDAYGGRKRYRWFAATVPASIDPSTRRDRICPAAWF